MSSKREQALHMYMNEQCTQRHIAQTVGVSERTIFNWINDNAWDRLKKASYAAPAMIADNICLQIVNLQEAIAGRAQGQQFPTLQEAEITRKLVFTLEKLKRYPSTGQNMQILETFRRFVWNGSPTDAAAIDRWKSRFIEGNAKNGFLPHEIEYNANYITPFMFPHHTTADDTNTPPEPPPSTAPQTRNFSQSEITPQNTPQHTDNQSFNANKESEPNQKKSEIPQHTTPQPTIQPTSQPTSFPPGEGRDGAPSPSPKIPTLYDLLAPLRKHKEDLLREAAEALANQKTSNNTQSEIPLQNTTQNTDNQPFNNIQESATSQKKSEIPQQPIHHNHTANQTHTNQPTIQPTNQPTIQPTSQPTSFPPGEGRDGAILTHSHHPTKAA